MGLAANGAQALQQVESLHPDVAVIDMLMPDINGLEVTRQIRERLPDTQVVVHSMYSDEGYVINAMRSGACAYVLKESFTPGLWKNRTARRGSPGEPRPRAGGLFHRQPAPGANKISNGSRLSSRLPGGRAAPPGARRRPWGWGQCRWSPNRSSR